MLKKLLAVLLVLATFAACTTVTVPQDPANEENPSETPTEEKTFTTIEERTAGWNVYGNEQSALTFKYPADWQATVDENKKEVVLDFGRGEKITFQVSMLPIPHGTLSALAKLAVQEKGVYNKYLTKGKYFYNAFVDFRPAQDRSYLSGTIFYSHEYDSGEDQTQLSAYQVDFKMDALDVKLTEAKEILKYLTYKNFWYILHTLHLKEDTTMSA